MRDFSFIPQLKEEPKVCTESVAKEKDTFGILLAGFGKSIIFQLHASSNSQGNMESEQKGSNIAIVLPLFLIMKDQMQEFSWLGIETVAIRLGDEEEKKSYESVAA